MSLNKKGVSTSPEIREKQAQHAQEVRQQIRERKEKLKEKSRKIQESLCDENGTCELDLKEL